MMYADNPSMVRSTPLISILLLCLCCGGLKAQTSTVRVNDSLLVKTSLLYEENFDTTLDNWVIEQKPGGTVMIKNGAMEIEDASGCTVWFSKKLNEPVMITYEVVVISADGPHDRVSDLNCFWLATDPWHPENFFRQNTNRDGRFGSYDSLKLYYVGLGGHHNSKTRFRRYDGEGNKPLLPGHDLSAPEFMIVPNQVNHIKIIVYNKIIQYYRNDVCIFNFVDPSPISSGYFGLRTVNNHMRVDNLRIFSLN